jgi:DNA-binding winged helix-turn-helix (wHTH) protein/Tfp pilus assembly protein PilF
MSKPVGARVVYEFGPFRVDPAESRLLRDGIPVAVTPKTFETLMVLLSRAGRLVEKAELLREVWPDTVVEESSLSQHVYLVRKALGDERGEARCIETVPKRGYRFVAPVRVRPGPEAGDGRREAPCESFTAAHAPASVTNPSARASRLGRARVALGAVSRPRASAILLTLGLAGLALLAAGALRRGPALPQPGTARPAAPATGGRAARPARRATVPGRPDAYDAYVRGLYFWNQRTDEGLRQASRFFEDAVARDPDYAQAHAGLADATALLATMRYGPLPPEQAYEKARAAAQRALQIDDTLAAAHTALALILARADGDRLGAEREYRIALRLDPGSATALQRYARLLVEDQRLDPAVEVTQRALALDPLSPALSSNLCYLLYLQREHRRAVGYCDKAIELQPDLVQARTTRALIEAQNGSLEVAQAQLTAARRGARGTALIELLEVQGYVHALAGRRDDARATLGELRGLTREHDPERISMLSIHAALGDTEHAFELLRSCAREWPTQPFEVAFDPRYDSLRDDPRYAEVMSPPPTAVAPRDGLVGGAGDHHTLSTVY